MSDCWRWECPGSQERLLLCLALKTQGCTWSAMKTKGSDEVFTAVARVSKDCDMLKDDVIDR